MTNLDEQPSLCAAGPALHPPSADPAFGCLSPEILVVEPDVALLHAEVQFLTHAHYAVAPAFDQGEILALRETKVIALVILSDTLGPRLLSAVARTVRKQWPLARILLLGRPAAMLEDYLYDEEADHPAHPRQLLDDIERLYSHLWNQHSNSADREVKRPHPAEAQNRICESDPSKTQPVESAVESTPRDLPALMKYRRYEGPVSSAVTWR